MSVVAVLLRVEPAPLASAQIRRLGPEHAVGAPVAVGDDEPGDLVVALVGAEAAVVGVERRRRVAALGQPADGWFFGSE